MKRPLRVFLGLNEVSGFLDNLCNSLKSIGVEASVVVSSNHPFGYNVNKNTISYIWLKINYLVSCFKSKNVKRLFLAFHRIFGFIVLLHSLFKYDVFLFTSGQTFFQLEIDTFLIRLFRKKVIFYYVGSDTRPAYMDGFYLNGSEKRPDLKEIYRRTKKQYKILRRQERCAHYCINSPASGHFHQSSFVNCFALGYPSPPKKVAEKACVSHELRDIDSSYKLITFLHIPSSFGAKGSKEISQVINSLRESGFKVQLKTLSNVPHSKVIEEISSSDFIIDQLYSDAPSASLATESVSLNKPCIVGGYFVNYWDRWNVLGEEYETTCILPESLKSTIEEFVLDSTSIEVPIDSAEHSLRVIGKNRKIAYRFLLLFLGQAPAEWFYNPQIIDYTEGAGINKYEVYNIYSDIINCYGTPGLFLKHNPTIIEKIKFLAGQS